LEETATRGEEIEEGMGSKYAAYHRSVTSDKGGAEAAAKERRRRGSPSLDQGSKYAAYHRSVTGGADADEWGKEQRRRGSPGLTGPHAVQRQGPGPEGLGGDSGISDDARDQGKGAPAAKAAAAPGPEIPGTTRARKELFKPGGAWEKKHGTPDDPHGRMKLPTQDDVQDSIQAAIDAGPPLGAPGRDKIFAQGNADSAKWAKLHGGQKKNESLTRAQLKEIVLEVMSELHKESN
tara:strand:- start:249 stop:953 length:705 start_codon:yes stop_codon:yes gene_type:complete